MCLQATTGESASSSTKRDGLRDSGKRIEQALWDTGQNSPKWHCLNNFETIPVKRVRISRTLVEKLQVHKTANSRLSRRKINYMRLNELIKDNYGFVFGTLLVL